MHGGIRKRGNKDEKERKKERAEEEEEEEEEGGGRREEEEICHVEEVASGTVGCCARQGFSKGREAGSAGREG